MPFVPSLTFDLLRVHDIIRTSRSGAHHPDKSLVVNGQSLVQIYDEMCIISHLCLTPLNDGRGRPQGVFTAFGFEHYLSSCCKSGCPLSGRVLYKALSLVTNPISNNSLAKVDVDSCSTQK